ncbi:MAG: dihydrofolate reductase family protein [Anaerolineae bacterium]|nr:dihydrofolate reductase family protein [Anaerolineae bacterium]
MGKVVYDISMSLDGFISGPNVRLEAGLGDGGERLHEWGFNSTDPRNRELVEAWVNTGAVIVGRKTYDLSIQYWGADGPIYTARVPVIVLSHSVPTDVPAGGVYTFVDSVETAFEKAKQAAGDKDIGVQGPNTAQQFIKRGLVDEISIHLVPVLFGSGIRLFAQPDGEHVPLETIEVIETKEAIHLRFRVIK